MGVFFFLFCSELWYQNGEGETDFCPGAGVNKEKEGQAKIITDKTKHGWVGPMPFFIVSRRTEVKVCTCVSCQAPVESTSWALTQQNTF